MRISSAPGTPIYHTGQGPRNETVKANEPGKSESQNSDIDVLGKCIRIATHIINGDKIPPQDDKFLFEHNPDMHQRAWMLRREKEKPDECESELDDDDTKKAGGETGSPDAPDMPEFSVDAGTAEVEVSVEMPEMDFLA